MARHKARFPNTTKNIFFPAFLEVCIEKLEGYGGATSMAVFHWCLACLWWLPSKPWSLTSSNMECKTDGFSTQSLAGFLLLGSWALAANSCLLVILGLVVEQLLLGCQWFGVLQDWQGDSLLAYSGKLHVGCFFIFTWFDPPVWVQMVLAVLVKCLVLLPSTDGPFFTSVLDHVLDLHLLVLFWLLLLFHLGDIANGYKFQCLGLFDGFQDVDTRWVQSKGQTVIGSMVGLHGQVQGHFHFHSGKLLLGQLVALVQSLVNLALWTHLWHLGLGQPPLAKLSKWNFNASWRFQHTLVDKGPCGLRQSLELKDFAIVLLVVLLPDMGYHVMAKTKEGEMIFGTHQLVTPSCIQGAFGEASHAGSGAKPCFGLWPGWCL